MIKGRKVISSNILRQCVKFKEVSACQILEILGVLLISKSLVYYTLQITHECSLKFHKHLRTLFSSSDDLHEIVEWLVSKNYLKWPKHKASLVSTYVVCQRLSVMHQEAKLPEILQNTPVLGFGSPSPTKKIVIWTDLGTLGFDFPEPPLS